MKENKNNIPKGYKQSAVGVIPEEWEVKKLGSLSTVKGQYGLNEAAIDYNPNYPTYIRITDIDDKGKFKSKNKKSVITQQKNDYLLKTNDILFARTGGTVGKSYIHKEKNGELVFAGFLIRFRTNEDKLNSFYLKNFSETNRYWRWVEETSVRSGQPGLSAKDYQMLQIPLPPLPEQKKIAEILSTWDLAIEKCEAAISALKKRNKGLAQQLLKSPLPGGDLGVGPAEGKHLRLKGFEGEWKEYRYEDIIKEVKRPVEWNDEDLYRLISVRRRSGGLFQRESLYGKEIKTKNLRTAKENDFLISKMQIVHGAAGLVTKEFDDMKISGSYISVRSKSEATLDIRFLNWYSKLPEFYHQTFVSSFGVHIEKMTFSFKLFLKEKIKLPKIEEQKAIVNLLEQADRELELQIAKRDALQEQKKGLMQKLLTGEVRVKI